MEPSVLLFEESERQSESYYEQVQLQTTYEDIDQIISKCKQIVELSKNPLSYSKSFKPIIQGYLNKKTNNNYYTLKYFVLTTFRLLYYTNEECTQLQGCFDLSVLEQCELSRTDRKINLQFKVGKILLKAQSITEADRWYNQLYTLLDKPPFLRPVGISIDYDTKYWTEIVINTSQFEHYAQNFDIVLFKTKSLSSYLQRMVTMSEYDHVGLVLRTEYDDILILQATANQGVNMVSWDQLKKMNLGLVYEKIGFRKLLDVNKNAATIEKLEQYLDMVLGKKYQISFEKLVRSRWAKDEIDDNQNRTFFCSELVADVYRKFGYLDSRKSSCSYWPRHFAEGLALKYGRLSDIMIVQP